MLTLEISTTDKQLTDDAEIFREAMANEYATTIDQ